MTRGGAAPAWWVAVLVLAGATGAPAGGADDTPTADAFPPPTQSALPWTRWWWHGSAVDERNLTRLLEEYQRVGLGGVEVTCIYGVKPGHTDHPRVEYLSPEWVRLANHALAEAERLGMGVDLPPGSGWRMGGPWLDPQDGNRQLRLDRVAVAAGGVYRPRLPEGETPDAVVAYGPEGRMVDLTAKARSGALEWTPPAGEWTVYTVTSRLTREQVKRPAPGGAGLNINPFDARSVRRFLNGFGERLNGLRPGVIRASFHDSFEYEGNWRPEFFDEFEARRGYRLQDHLPELDGRGDPDRVARVKHDYRDTLGELSVDGMLGAWVAWCHERGWLARNQGHGSPGNWIDYYAAVDIPETETFGRLTGDETNLLCLKFASSAAHLTGKPLVASETATWLDEHYQETLGQLRQAVDRQALAGINHVVYQGTAYSPDDAPWPGWVFYASTQLNPQNPLWRDFPAVNAYVARSQSLLQRATPDNDVLLYWPLHDYLSKGDGLRKNLLLHNARQWLFGEPVGEVASAITDAGYSFDFVSDRILDRCRAEGGRVQSPGADYAVVLVPRCRTMPVATLAQLRRLAERGATVLFAEGLPQTTPGLVSAQVQAEFDRLVQLTDGALGAPDADGVRAASLGAGRVLVGGSAVSLLKVAAVRREPMAAEGGLGVLRKRLGGDSLYLVCNPRDESYDGWVTPAVEGRSVVVLDPWTGRAGRALTRDRQVRLRLAPKQSLFLRVSAGDSELDAWPLLDPRGQPAEVRGPWRLEFVAGGPSLPSAQSLDAPTWWTDLDDPACEAFAGTGSYRVTFDAPRGATGPWRLDLGAVADSARVTLNGEAVATLVAAPYVVDVPTLRSEQNELVVEVTGVAANRIRDLDRRKVAWRVFDDINFVSIDYRQFDASGWPVRPGGLAGPVTLTPLGPAD